MKGLIYVARNNINGMCYVGLTTKTLHERKQRHEIDARGSYSNMYFHRAIRAYGSENFSWKVIDTADNKKDLCMLEKIYIDMFDSFNTGYNSTFGGEGLSGHIPSKQTRKKLSEAGKNREYTPEVRKRISDGKMGHEVSAETRKKISRTKRNQHRKHTPEHIEYLRKINSGENNAMYGKKQKSEIVAKSFKPVIQYSKSGEVICEYKSVKYAGEKTGICAMNIASVCRGKRNYAGGFAWKFREDVYGN